MRERTTQCLRSDNDVRAVDGQAHRQSRADGVDPPCVLDDGTDVEILRAVHSAGEDEVAVDETATIRLQVLFDACVRHASLLSVEVFSNPIKVLNQIAVGEVAADDESISAGGDCTGRGLDP